MKRKLYAGSDPVEDMLLSHVSHHVIPTDRKQFALQCLRMPDGKYESIETDNRGNSKAVSLEVSHHLRLLV